MEHRRSVIIVGGGFAGTSAARALAGRLPADVDLTLLSEESYTTFNPLLPEAVGASIFPEQVVAPLRELLMPDGRSRFIMGRVTRVDTAARLLRCSTLGGERELALRPPGAGLWQSGAAGLAAGHGRACTAAQDRRRCARDPQHRAAPAGAHRAAARPGTAPRAGPLCGDRRWLFWRRGGGRIGRLPGQHPALLPAREGGRTQGHGAARRRAPVAGVARSVGRGSPEVAAAGGVQVQLRTRAQRLHEHGVELTDGTLHGACTVVGTIGTRPNALVTAMGLPTERGRIVVAGDLSVPGYPGVWALGDCAQVPNAHDGKFAPPTAQFAVHEGCLLAHNLVRAVNGKRTRDFNHKSRGAMASIGHMKGLAQVFGLPLSGLPAWLLWRAYYLSQMPTLGRKLRIFVKWTWGMFFPTDITHLRFPGSQAVNAAEREDRERAASSLPVRG